MAEDYQQEVLDALRSEREVGLTAHQIAGATDLEMVQINRLKELQIAGKIKLTGETHGTPPGRKARVWRVVG